MHPPLPENVKIENRAGPGPARPGRPRIGTDEHRRAQAMEAARRVFLERGFHGTTMEDIARSAGMSKKTIYQAFASKEALLAAVFVGRLEVLTRPLEAEDEDRPIFETLQRLLLQFLRFALSPEEIATVRLLVAECLHAECAEVLRGQGPFIGRTTLAKFLARQGERGVLHITDANSVAEMLVGMALGELHMKMLMNVMERPSDAELEQRVERVVGVFLDGIRKSVLF